MKKKKLIIILLAIFVPLATLTSAFFIYVSDYYHSKPYEHEVNIKIIKENDYSLYYLDENIKDNLFIFYPGAKVESKAYEGLVENIALVGVDVMLVNMPFNLAFFGMNRASEILDKYNYEHYYIGGHSFGGAMAASYAKDNANKLDGTILFASYATSKMPDTLKCLAIRGNNDKVINENKFNKNKTYFNNELYKEIIIDGGNHSNFGKYGFQKGDGEASISNLEQWNITSKEILEFVNMK